MPDDIAALRRRQLIDAMERIKAKLDATLGAVGVDTDRAVLGYADSALIAFAIIEGQLDRMSDQWCTRPHAVATDWDDL